MPKLNQRKHTPPASQVSEMCQLYTDGKTIRGLSRIYHMSDPCVRRILTDNDIRIRSAKEQDQYRYDVMFFSRIDTEAKAYFLGLMYADGFVSNRSHRVSVGLKLEDASILSDLSRLIAKGEDITRSFTAMKNPLYGRMLQIDSFRIKADLIKLGCVPTKTFKIRLPNLPADMMRHFFRGYFDGDGCLHIGRGRSLSSEKRATFKVVSCTPFCEDVATYMKAHHGLYLGVYHPSKNPNVAAFQTGNDETIKSLYRYMYTDATIFMSRKKSLFESFFAIRCIDPHNISPEVKNRRRSFTQAEREERQKAFTSKETWAHGLPLWDNRA